MSVWQVGDVVRLHDGREFEICGVQWVPLAQTWPLNKIKVRRYIGYALVDGVAQIDFDGFLVTDQFSGFDIAAG